ncbi:predicted protein [Naegleria gruberi]|uniref:Predicted protein n=1 Tax=Naegleria gruberi TaxID=5762 RepID=D2VRW9_NAEGR|nr:uncharacterized protein NAEGRDRAFT_71733 [Naegleria gruberi]EFC40537.1 predicted protein [Naegleria gruberi]|eukprot:XP_002673281.1 predicted protein [Naegleria gruberi strain NEG-M]
MIPSTPSSALPNIISSCISSDSLISLEDSTNINNNTTTTTITSPQNSSNDSSLQIIKNMGIEYIFLAEFDIDKGSIVKVQYPSPYPYATEYSIANLMLPDGSHNCIEDTTVFFLRGNNEINNNHHNENNTSASSLNNSNSGNNNSSILSNGSNDGGEEAKSSPRNSQEVVEKVDLNTSLESTILSSDQVITEQSKKEEIFYYVLNVQKQKKYEGLRRAARVKSLAIVSKHPYCFSLRDLLSKALDHIFDAYDHTAYSKERKKDENESLPSSLSENNLQQTDLIDGLVQTLVEHIFETCNSIDLSSMKLYTAQEKLFWRYTIAKKKHTTHNLMIRYQYGNKVEQFPTSIPICLSDNEIQYQLNGITQTSLCRLVTNFKENTMLIFNAILYQKRIVFFSGQQLAGQVVNTLLSSLVMFPFLHDLLKKRTFPYASFSNLEFLDVEGYIVGVCNPMFAQREEYYDLLVDIDKMEVKVSQTINEVRKEVKKQEKKEKKELRKRRGSKVNSMDVKNISNQQDKSLFGSMLMDTMDIIDTIGVSVGVNKPKTFDDICFLTNDDLQFIKEIIELIQFRTPKSNNFEMLEDLIRSKFYSYSKSIIDLAFDQEKQILYQQQLYHGSVPSNQEAVTDNIKKALAWRSTLSFKENKRIYRSGRRQVHISTETLNIESAIQKLRKKTLPEEELISIFQTFIKHVNTREEILEFLTFLPENEGGIEPIAICTLHSSEMMRLLSVSFLKKIETIEEGRLLVQNMNMFLLLGYDRGTKLYN